MKYKCIIINILALGIIIIFIHVSREHIIHVCHTAIIYNYYTLKRIVYHKTVASRFLHISERSIDRVFCIVISDLV